MHAPLASVLAVLSLASTSLASSHHSHNVRGLSHPHHGVELLKSRALGSRGKGGPARLTKRGQAGEAVLKCTSAKTFQLCDGDRCTDMGSVAAGTMCKDGAITWDTTGEVSESPAASSAVAEFVSSKVESASSVLSSSSSVSAAEATVRVKQNAVQTSFTTPGPSSTQAAAAAPSAASSSSSSSDDEDWECEADDSEEADSSSSTTYTTSAAAVEATTSAAPQLAVKPKTTTTTTQAPATTTSAAPIVSASVSLGTGSTDWITGGKATFFYQEGGYGACGKIHQDSDFGVALQIDRYGTSSNSNPDCGKQLLIKNNANGKTVTASVWDACPGCANYNSLDLSVGAFDAIGDQATGVLDISWHWI